MYGHTNEPTLRLVTCSGHFDPQVRSYDANTVVFLRLVGTDGTDPDVETAAGTGTGKPPQQ